MANTPKWLHGYRNTLNSGGSASGTVPDSRLVSAGAGLTGGGSLAADRTISLATRYLADATQQNLTAAGANQATATAIADTSHLVYVNGGAASNGVRLPASPVVGDVYTINVASSVLANPNSGTGIVIYPTVGDKFRHRAIDAGVTLYAFQTLVCRCVVGGAGAVWEAINLPGFYDAFQEMALTPQLNHYGVYLNTSSIQAYGNIQLFSGAPIVFNGTTGTNLIRCIDNLAEGLWLGEGTNRYLTLRTTNGDEAVLASVPLLDRRKASSHTVDVAVATADSGRSFNNIGAGGEVIFTLPATVTPGVVYRFRVAAAQYLQIKANTGHVIYAGTVASASAGFVRANTIGATIEIEGVDATTWMTTAIVATWLVDL